MGAHNPRVVRIRLLGKNLQRNFRNMPISAEDLMTRPNEDVSVFRITRSGDSGPSDEIFWRKKICASAHYAGVKSAPHELFGNLDKRICRRGKGFSSQAVGDFVVPAHGLQPARRDFRTAPTAIDLARWAWPRSPEFFLKSEFFDRGRVERKSQ